MITDSEASMASYPATQHVVANCWLETQPQDGLFCVLSEILYLTPLETEKSACAHLLLEL